MPLAMLDRMICWNGRFVKFDVCAVMWGGYRVSERLCELKT
jgi:hypothetical protein